MSTPNLSRLPSLLVLLCMTLALACDQPAGAESSSKEKNRSRSESSRRHREKDKGDGDAFKVGRFDRKAIPESSGVVASRKHPGVFWTHNDSGNGPTLFAVTRDGKVLGQYAVNVRNNDWEAISTDDEGHLYIGDIGNNDRQRDRLIVYRVDEPNPTTKTRHPAGPLRATAMWRLKYPGDPFDAEGLFVHQGRGYIVSKLLNGKQAGVYSFDLSGQAEAQTLRHVCDLPLRSPVTDAAISQDGSRLAVMTVTGPSVFEIDGDVASAPRAKQKSLTYFDLKDLNMEGVCFVPEGLLATTEAGQVLVFAEKYLE